MILFLENDLGQGNLINVDVYGVEMSVFQQREEDFLAMGYRLQCRTESPAEVLAADICIVDVSRMDDCRELLQQKNTPYLISGINLTPPLTGTVELPFAVLKNSVGFMNASPLLADISISIRLGLLWHDEREKYSQRVQNIESKINNNRVNGIAIGMLMQQSGLLEHAVMNCLKQTSRNKRRRMVDVSAEVIDKLALLDQAQLSTEAQLLNWLKETVSCRLDSQGE
ncbi:MAG: ANTAR domain-containing protein [Cycloclasticus sp.]